MDALAVTQTIFYAVSSLAIIVLGVLLGMILYKLFRTVKDVENITGKIRFFLNKLFKKGK